MKIIVGEKTCTKHRNNFFFEFQTAEIVFNCIENHGFILPWLPTTYLKFRVTYIDENNSINPNGFYGLLTRDFAVYSFACVARTKSISSKKKSVTSRVKFTDDTQTFRRSIRR